MFALHDGSRGMCMYVYSIMYVLFANSSCIFMVLSNKLSEP